MENRWSLVGGIMSIVSGAFGVIGGLSLVAFGALFASLISFADSTSSSGPTSEQLGTIFGLIYGGMGVFLLLFGVLALIGGIYSIKKRLWGLALAGSIGGTIAFFPVGVAAVIFTAMAKPEFDSSRPTQAASLG